MNFKFIDSHIHLSEVKENFSQGYFKDIIFLSTAFSQKDFFILLNLKENFKLNMLISLGVHPLDFLIDRNDFQNFIENSQIDAIGECGFDFFKKPNFEEHKRQKEIFELQLNIALKYNLPLVLHLRKAMGEIFLYKKELKQLKAVIFHSFSGTIFDVNFILKNKINAFFSFGTALLNNHKKTIETFKQIPINKVLFETDAPFQPLRGEKINSPKTIFDVYKEASNLKDVDENLLQKEIYKNFNTIFND